MKKYSAFATLLVALACLACNSADDHHNEEGGSQTTAVPTANRLRINGGLSSPEEVASRALVAFAASDTATLMRLLIKREEFVNALYPEYAIHYPAARDTSVQTRDFLWENQSLSSLAALRSALRDLQGRNMELLDVSFRDGATGFKTYRIHEGTQVRVRFDDGREANLHALGSMVEIDGAYKLLTYRDRD